VIELARRRIVARCRAPRSSTAFALACANQTGITAHADLSASSSPQAFLVELFIFAIP
jgi:hypothetical protein